MDTLPGHFIRYIWQAPGQLNQVVGEYTRLRVWTRSVFRNAFLQILVVNIGYCRWLSVVSNRSAHFFFSCTGLLPRG